MKKNYQVSFAIICIILGIGISLQYKSMQKNALIQNQEDQSIQEVQAQLISQKEYSESLLNKIEEYEQKIENYEQNVDIEEMLKKDLEQARVFAGLSDIIGKGITLTIDDTKTSEKFKGITPTGRYTVSDLNLLELINELRAAGAEAISINDERILAMTEIRKAGYYIRINNKNYNSPFTIKAIGDPTVLEGSLRIREGIVEYLTINNVDITISQSDEVVIPKYKGTLNLKNLNNTTGG